MKHAEKTRSLEDQVREAWAKDNRVLAYTLLKEALPPDLVASWMARKMELGNLRRVLPEDQVQWLSRKNDIAHGALADKEKANG